MERGARRLKSSNRADGATDGGIVHAAFHLTGELLGAFLAPPRCASCHRRVPLLRAFCPPCAASVQPIGRTAGGFAAYAYGGAVGRAIAAFKYERRPDLARPLGDLLWRAIEPSADALRDALVVPVPLHPTRLAERGYNQSALLARRLARRLGARCLPVALGRIRETAQQTSLDREARADNLAGAFVARRPAELVGRAVLLVDDVRTTGATLDACQDALQRAGVRRIRWAVVARAG